MQAALAFALLLMGGFLLYEIFIGNATQIFTNLRQGNQYGGNAVGTY
jgi:hypothetical protein